MAKILCLDVGSYSIKSLLMETSFKRYQMLEFHETVLPEECRNIDKGVKSRSYSIRGHLETNYSKYNFDELKVYSLISGDKTVVKILKFPFRDKAKIRQALRFELENYVPFNLDNWVIESCIQPSENRESSVVTVLVQKNDIQSTIGEFAGAPCEPVRISSDSIVVSNLDELNLYSQRSYGLINIGHTKTNVTIVENGTISMVRSVPIGGHHLTMMIARACNLSYLEAEEKKHREAIVYVDEELERVNENNRPYNNAILDFCYDLMRLLKQSIYSLKIQDKGLITKIYLSGGTARVRRLDRFLSRELRLGVSDCLIGELEGNKIGIDFDRNLVPTPFALGLQELVRNPVADVNFRRGEFACNREDEGKKRIIKNILSYGAVSTCLFLCLFFVMCGVRKSKQSSSYRAIAGELEREFPAIYKKVVKSKHINQRKIRKIKLIMKEEKGKIDRDLQLIDEVEKTGMSILEVLRGMSTSLSSEVKFDIYKLEFGNNRVAIEANASSLKTISKIVRSLEKNANFASVSESGTKAAVTGGGQDFKLRFDMKYPES